MVWIESESGERQEVNMSMEEVQHAIQFLVKERERIKIKSRRYREAKGAKPRNFRPKPPADAPKRPRGRPRKTPVPEISVEIPA